MSDEEEEERYKVFAKVKVMPEDPDVELDIVKDGLKDKVPESFKINKVEEEPVAFGLTALMITVLGPDQAGGFDPVEESFGEIENVREVSIADIGRL